MPIRWFDSARQQHGLAKSIVPSRLQFVPAQTANGSGWNLELLHLLLELTQGL